MNREQIIYAALKDRLALCEKMAAHPNRYAAEGWEAEAAEIRKMMPEISSRIAAAQIMPEIPAI